MICEGGDSWHTVICEGGDLWHPIICEGGDSWHPIICEGCESMRAVSHENTTMKMCILPTKYTTKAYIPLRRKIYLASGVGVGQCP